MSFRLVGLCAALLLTAGCSRFTGLFRSADEDAAPPAMAAMAVDPVPIPASTSADWCTRLAAGARSSAIADGFDAATQERMAQQTLRQCVAMNQQG